MVQDKNKMKVEIWSDIMCSFCYMAKAHFDTALAEFPAAAELALEWKSFQLAPHLETEPGKSLYQSVAENTGISLEDAKKAGEQLTEMAKQAGLDFNLGIGVPANSFRAHCFSKLAKTQGLQDKAEELLFRAYFTEGKNINDIATLAGIGAELGLDAADVSKHLESNRFAEEVREDLLEAQQLGVRSVPLYVINGKHRLAGVQSKEIYLRILEEAHAEWAKEHGLAGIGASCSVDGNCG